MSSDWVALTELYKFWNLRDFLKHDLQSREITNIKRSDDENNNALVIWKKARSATERWGSKFYFVYLSGSGSLDKLASDHDRVISLAKGIELKMIDTSQSMKAVNPMEILGYAG